MRTRAYQIRDEDVQEQHIDQDEAKAKQCN
jgi:hypothetical protein